MTAAEATNKEGGVIIVVAGRADGTGGEGFYQNLGPESPTLSVNESVGPYRVDRIGAAALCPPQRV
jgi:lactate racemase